ncbi:MAG: hypothetical protein GWQ05_14885 [Verrucomicrobiaceae bacterium]|jgi:hypothetical protein|nr:hypothetical protein [Verrucomicrobiales bacterium]MDF1790239.1 hypothetical protein [Verrucomicrobiales bacterium]NCF84716.1 hypothetical protein [Verrucomicrobiaceae bacterium]NCF92223.1 hypothetical protein [Verrucomicrobiaceae bacterium]
MKTLEQKYATISEMNIDVSKGFEQFTWEQIEACDTVTQAILDFNLKGAPKPEIPETANIKLAQVQDMQLASEIL